MTEFDFAEKRVYLYRPNLASDDIAKILPPSGSNNIDKLHLPKNAFRPVGEAVMAIDFKKCCTAKEQQFRYLNENHFRTYLWLVYSQNRKGLYCKCCDIFSSSLVNSGVRKNRQKPGKLVVIEPFCSFNKLTGSYGYVYEQDRLEYQKSMTIEVRW